MDADLIRRLNTLSAKYIETDGKNLSYERLAEDIALFTGARFAVINTYHKEKNVTRTRAIAGSKSIILQAMKTLGFPLVDREYPIDTYAEEMLGARELKHFDRISILAENHISRRIVSGLERMTNLGPVYAMGLYSDNRVFGDVILIFPDSGPDPERFNKEMAEMLVRLIASVLVKKRIDSQKEILSREIHHRVKNNLQVILSILSMQRAKSSLPDVKARLADIETRITSMALIHEYLYKSDDLSTIYMPEYLQLIIDNMKQVFSERTETICIQLEAEDLVLDIDSAIPCGILITELVTNSFKYAFPEKGNGIIVVSFHKKREQYSLSVRDNGTGFKEKRKSGSPEHDGLGKKLVSILSEQLGGKVSVKSSENGTDIGITFPAR